MAELAVSPVLKARSVVQVGEFVAVGLLVAGH